MFDFFRRHIKLLQFVLLPLIFLSFGLFGIESYTRSSAANDESVAKVAGQSISRTELDNVIRERLERARQQMPTIDAKLFDTPEARRAALETVIRGRLASVAADKLHLLTSDERLDRHFKTDPEFAQLRNPDGSVNRDLLVSLGMTSEGFAERLRQDISRRQVTQGLLGSVIAPAAAASAALDAMYQQREVQVQRFQTQDQLAKVAPTDAEVESFYNDPSHAAQFQAPEEASVEYVVLDSETLKKSVVVGEDDLRRYYTENQARYTAPEERRASHILVKADKDASKAERDKARAKAEGLLAEVRKTPAAFADLARKNSDDEGSATKGGDLDFFARGAMVKPFEDAAFGLKTGETSVVVESDFGYHIIQVTGARGGEKKSFESVRPEMETALRTQLAQKLFSEAAVEFSDTVYEQADSLKPAADKWKLEVKKAEHVTRTPPAGSTGPLANARFLEALFSSDATKDKRNTKAVDIGSNQLAAGRVLQYAPAHRLALAEVKDKVRQQLAARQAAALARKIGAERLAALRSAPATNVTEKAQIVSRAQAADLAPAVLDAVLRAPAANLPAFVGIDLGDQGYAVAKISRIAGRDPAVSDPVQAKTQYAQVWADAEGQAYFAALRTRYKVTMNDSALAPRDAAASEPR